MNGVQNHVVVAGVYVILHLNCLQLPLYLALPVSCVTVVKNANVVVVFFVLFLFQCLFVFERRIFQRNHVWFIRDGGRGRIARPCAPTCKDRRDRQPLT